LATEVVAELVDEGNLDVLREEFELTNEQIDDAVEYEHDVREAVAA
jgi:uncharacterized protein (DUF433 family)